MGDVAVSARELGRIADGLCDSLRDHRGFMHKLHALEGAMLQQLAAADMQRPLTEASQPLEPLLQRNEAVQRKRTRRKFARAALGALKKPSLSMVVALAPTILADSEDDPEPPAHTPRTADPPTAPYSPNRHCSPFVEPPSSGGRRMDRPPRRAVEARLSLDVDAANRRGAALWTASLRGSSKDTSISGKFDVYRMLSVAWLQGHGQRMAIAERLQEALDIPAPYGIQLQQVEAVARVHRALCSNGGQHWLDKLQLLALVTPSEDDGCGIGAPPPGRCRADTEAWLLRESVRDPAAPSVNRRMAHAAAAAARPPPSELTRDHHTPLVRSTGGAGFEPRPPPIEQIVLTSPPWPPSEQLVAVQTQLDNTRVGSSV